MFYVFMFFMNPNKCIFCNVSSKCKGHETKLNLCKSKLMCPWVLFPLHNYFVHYEYPECVLLTNDGDGDPKKNVAGLLCTLQFNCE